MASSKQDEEAAAAAEQLGSISLGKSVERNTEPESVQNEAPAKMCSACGKKSDALKKCTACKCVWYCDKKCQNKHRKEHRKDCKRIKNALGARDFLLGKREGKLDIGTEKDLGPLPDLPPQDECPICMRVLPIPANLQRYAGCCGKSICGGCSFQHQMKSAERAAERGQTLVSPTCAFCRKPMAQSDEEILARGLKRIELKDPSAMSTIAMAHGHGRLGLPVDQAKCIDLLRQSADLGDSSAQFQLGIFHHNGNMGLQRNEEEALKYYKKAAEGGYLVSRHNLGSTAAGHGDFVAAMRHWRLAASRGLKISMENLIVCFEDGLLFHGDLSETLQIFYHSRAEMKSEDRDRYIEHLKKTGEYVAENHDF